MINHLEFFLRVQFLTNKKKFLQYTYHIQPNKNKLFQIKLLKNQMIIKNITE